MTESDRHQLLPGEHPGSSEAEDAAHWVAVYTELMEALGRQQQTEPFQETLDRYRVRLSYWRGRLDDLSGDEVRHADAPQEAS